MEIKNTFYSATMPYEKLRLLGISKEAADNLPIEFRRSLSQGEVTPLLRVSIKAPNGVTVSMPIKLQMTLDSHGERQLLVHPVRRELTMETAGKYGLTRYEKDRLDKGETLRKEIDRNGMRKTMFIQLDPETKSILRRPVSEVKMEKRLTEIEKIKDIDLGLQQKQAAREGKPIELNVGGEKVTVGVDLREPNGFRVMRGDMKEWDRQLQMKYDVVHPEYMGLVLTDKNRWEYQQVVKHDEQQRAFKMSSSRDEESVKSSIKL